MSTYTQILYQLVFGSKDYSPFLTIENERVLFSYIAGILRNKDCHSYIVCGASNHVHIITHIHPTVALSPLIKDIKIASHKMILENCSLFNKFSGWQVGYGGFTYHVNSKENLIRYVEGQRKHNQICSFKKELTDLLKEHSVDYMDDYLLI
jgi:putative transposase